MWNLLSDVSKSNLTRDISYLQANQEYLILASFLQIE
jgi:hypothetical protein